jgi:hypothetical protein
MVDDAGVWCCLGWPMGDGRWAMAAGGDGRLLYLSSYENNRLIYIVFFVPQLLSRKGNTTIQTTSSELSTSYRLQHSTSSYFFIIIVYHYA